MLLAPMTPASFFNQQGPYLRHHAVLRADPERFAALRKAVMDGLDATLDAMQQAGTLNTGATVSVTRCSRARTAPGRRAGGLID